MNDSDFIIHDESFRRILRTDSRIERLAGGFGFTEGPVWIAAQGCLLFSDIPRNKIMRWEPGEETAVWREPSNNSNGNTLDRQGRLITCEHGSRRIIRTEPDGRITLLADRFGGRRLNSPNDAVVKSDGSIWFTDPPYGIPADKVEQPHNYVFRLDPGATEPVALVDDFAMPNGLCFSPDETRLYVADSSAEGNGNRHHIRVFDVQSDNTLAGGDVFAVIEPGVPDGMRTDTDGRLYSTAADGVHVFAPDATLLGRILTPETAANCTFGGPDRCTLFITATTSIYAVELAAGA